MTTISLSPKLVTLINVFTVEPANQQKLLELSARATENSVRHAPGFSSSSLHRGLDGTKVTMYAQRRSVEDYQAMRENPAPLPYLQRSQSRGSSLEYMKSSRSFPELARNPEPPMARAGNQASVSSLKARNSRMKPAISAALVSRAKWPASSMWSSTCLRSFP
jgi:hypothetical protein